jgi:hypothetical protein
MTDCAVLRIEKKAMVDALHREHTLHSSLLSVVLHD